MSNLNLAAPRALLFDLDGTLVDTAPDLVGTLYEMLGEMGVEPPAFAVCRNRVSQGARGLLELALGVTVDAKEYAALRSQFLDIYALRICRESQLFPGVAQMLKNLSEQHIAWGVATNKPTRFTKPLLAELDLLPPSGIVVTPDEVEQGKPHPAMIELAVEQLEVAAAECWFVGDARQDVTAGRGAGVVTAIAGWGYIEADEPTHEWQADLHFDDVAELAKVANSWSGSDSPEEL